MNFLTRIILGKSDTVCLGIGDSYAWHQHLWTAFPGHDGEDRHFLFRVDDKGREFQALLLSDAAPAVPDWGEWSVKEIAPSFLKHEVYRFQLRANPTMRRNEDRRRLGIYGEEKLRDWMQRKAELNGFALMPESLAVGAPQEEFFRKHGRRGKHVSVDFQGVLSVTHRTAFAGAFEKGIGSAKAFGFGLLMLTPVR